MIERLTQYDKRFLRETGIAPYTSSLDGTLTSSPLTEKEWSLLRIPGKYTTVMHLSHYFAAVRDRHFEAIPLGDGIALLELLHERALAEDLEQAIMLIECDIHFLGEDRKLGERFLVLSTLSQLYEKTVPKNYQKTSGVRNAL